ncbi:Pentatricopeptide repeat [Parasponia andersonii]|uniref:Pentatricopeptide repeat n=1 Tax=Parasponia andersonii TaxID=3476 RepID=A0A2P5A9I6_PARAD|nr:Pentatricopeptide repeat [Parasponia andersonii]
MRKALAVFGQMIHKDGRPNIVTYNSLLNGSCDLGYCIRGELDKVNKILDQMEASGVQPDFIYYYAIVKGYFKVERIKEALALLDKVIQKAWYLNV